MEPSKSLTEQKKILRKEIKERIRNLTPDYVARASQSIGDAVKADPDYKRADLVFCFVGTGGEPDTRSIIEDVLQRGKRVCVPLCTSDTEMEAIEIRNYDQDLAEGAYGILEPKEELPQVAKEDIQYALIPCVSCDVEGNRLGHGKGYYDRYLAGMAIPCAMLCYRKLMVPAGSIPIDIYDRKIDKVITDAE